MSVLGAAFDRLYRLLRRPVAFNDLGRPRPISAKFGFDRGTPVDRYYMERFIEKNSAWIKGRVLEVADSRYTRRYGAGKVDACEVLNPATGRGGIAGDLTGASTLAGGGMDCFICTQTFNVIFEVEKAVEGAHRLLRPGGVLLATVPGISHVSRYDMERWGDYWRFTTASAKALFEKVFKGAVEVDSFGNVASACAFLQGVAVEDLPDRSVLDERDPDYQVLITIVARKAL